MKTKNSVNKTKPDSKEKVKVKPKKNELRQEYFYDIVNEMIASKTTEEEDAVQIGSFLSVKRKEQKISIDKMSADLRIKASIIQKIEEGDRSGVAEVTYYNGCVILISKYLGLPVDDIVKCILKHDKVYDKKKLCVEISQKTMNINGQRSGVFKKILLALGVAAAILLTVSALNRSSKGNKSKSLAIESSDENKDDDISEIFGN